MTKKGTATLDPPYVFILSGGIGAGKTRIANQLKADFHFVVGSPAAVMKETLARHLAVQANGDDDYWEAFYNEMLDQRTKAEYRLLLQGFGEFWSNRDNYYWADQCVAKASKEYKTLALAGIPSGIVFDSIRRDKEIFAVMKQWPKAVHIRLLIDHARQLDYLTHVLGYTLGKAVTTLEHGSEHWLDSMDGTPYDAKYVIDANGGDHMTWVQLMGIVTLEMGGAKLTEVKNGEAVPT